jgi:hypothetical protein
MEHGGKAKGARRGLAASWRLEERPENFGFRIADLKARRQELELRIVKGRGEGIKSSSQEPESRRKRLIVFHSDYSSVGVVCSLLSKSLNCS